MRRKPDLFTVLYRLSRVRQELAEIKTMLKERLPVPKDGADPSHSASPEATKK